MNQSQNPYSHTDTASFLQAYEISPMKFPPGFSYFTLNALGLISVPSASRILNSYEENYKIINIFNESRYFDLLLEKLILDHYPSYHDVSPPPAELKNIKSKLMSHLTDSNVNLFTNIGEVYGNYIRPLDKNLPITSYFYYIPKTSSVPQTMMTYCESDKELLCKPYYLQYFLASDKDNKPTLVIFRNQINPETYIIQYNYIEQVSRIDFKQYHIYFMVYGTNYESSLAPYKIVTSPLQPPPSLDLDSSLDPTISLLEDYITYMQQIAQHYEPGEETFPDFILHRINNPILYLMQINPDLKDKVFLLQFHYLFFLRNYQHIEHLQIEEEEENQKMNDHLSEYYQFSIFASKMSDIISQAESKKIPVDQVKALLHYLPPKCDYLTNYAVQWLISYTHEYKIPRNPYAKYLDYCILNLEDYYQGIEYEDVDAIENTDFAVSEQQSIRQPSEIPEKLENETTIAEKLKMSEKQFIKPEYNNEYIQSSNDQSGKYLAIKY